MTAYYLRRTGETCAMVKVHPDGREEVIATGLSPADAELELILAYGEARYENPQLELDL